MNKTLFLVLCFASLTTTLQAATVTVYAAASLSNALGDIAKLYQAQQPNTKIVTVFGATSMLAKHIERGAPSDLFFSADQMWMDELVQKKLISADRVQPLLLNQLVAISPKNLHINFRPHPHFDFARSFKGYLCTAQMDSVPAGKYAKQSLTTLNWIASLKGRIVGTDDVRATLAFVERGECEVGIVYLTDALISQKVKVIGTFPSRSHRPIVYPLALTQQGQQNQDAVRFTQYLAHSSQADAIFQKYGFSLYP